ncbi:YggT family protein [Govanella unica]|uniref:YggT family protein n=1 Tax=Govanella unica TaxID=2975056 RepID=A0A9X3TVT8_9PROT|nr:YggT family protein [Govania unica]MDA5192640.1 YggT family protein [Govania unica]
MTALLSVILAVIGIFKLVLIASIILSWLFAFNLVNTGNRFVAGLSEVLYRLTEPVLRPVRNILPNLGAIDISPIVVFLLLYGLEVLIIRDIAPALGVAP